MAGETGKKGFEGDGMSQHSTSATDYYYGHNPECNCPECIKYHKQ
jgi:hypothetical protein